MTDIIERIIISEGQIQAIVRRIAEELRDAYVRAEKVAVLTILQGGAVFTRGLRDQGVLDESKFEFFTLTAASYGNSTRSSGTVQVDTSGLPKEALQGREVLIVDDIYDTGHTLHAVVEALREYRTGPVRICVLLERERRHRERVKVDFVGATIPSEGFVIGYGLDFHGHYRDLPYIATVKKEYCE